MKQRIRLTEQDLHRIIKESVKRILRESEYDPFEEGNAIICTATRDALTYGGGRGNAYGNGIYMKLGEHPEMPNSIMVYVDASQFLRAKSPQDAHRMATSGNSGIKGIIFNSMREGETCVVLDQSCILSRV